MSSSIRGKTIIGTYNDDSVFDEALKELIIRVMDECSNNYKLNVHDVKHYSDPRVPTNFIEVLLMEKE